jgi:hypothetical protein
MKQLRSYFILLFILGITSVVIHFTAQIRMEAIAGVDMNLPEKIGDWTGRPVEVLELEREILGKDTEFARKIYRDDHGNEIFLSIVLSGRDRTSIHPPEACLVSQGWTLSNGQVLKLPMIKPKPYDLEVMRLDTFFRPESREAGLSPEIHQWYYYWFIGQNRLTPRHHQRIFWTAWDRVFSSIHHRWAYVTVCTKVPLNNEKYVEEMVVKFIQEATPFFQKVEQSPSNF